MDRKEFMQILGITAAGTLSSLKAFSDTLPVQGRRMPVLFTSHGSPMDIPLSKEERPFWKSLYDLGKELQKSFDVKAALVVSAHWCTRGTYVNILPEQKQIYDYYGFPEEYYKVQYHAKGAPDIAKEVAQVVPSIKETTEWGLDHGAWPMLMHLFPEANIPVFQMSLDYHAAPSYHYELGKQLKSLRDKGVLIIGSGSLIHNLQLAGQKFRTGDMTPYGWETDYDAWIKQQIDTRDFNSIINYESSHKLGKLAAPTPDHFVPVLYSLGLTDSKDEIKYFYEGQPSIPAFSERSFLIGA
ncbi:dioxygenase [Chitinophaga sp. ysch24]|uniref:Dioxygenase n=2 Tax=Chitinophaga tropicalis TaxID=2683588 RepID=A0A7K1U8F9_9BACT|nr:dioxygenase [Chitinophaga tropicalis]